MTDIKILWIDDEIETLKPQLFFLNKKGYEVLTVTNGYDGLELLANDDNIDIVFLDETMPGLSGLETLSKIKEIKPIIPVVMITKNEAENIMEEAIGAQITDYLIKPVNPNQILLILKKIIDNERLIKDKTTSDYQQEFRNIIMEISSGMNYEEWSSIYSKLVKWELKLDSSNVKEMSEIPTTQKNDANQEFSKFIAKNYLGWIKSNDDKPVLSNDLMKQLVFPKMENDVPTVFILLDNLRVDHWKVFEPLLLDYYKKESEEYFYSILPSTTQYSRNAIFSGMMPGEIAKRYPEWWVNDFEDGGKNQFEAELLGEQIKRRIRKDVKFNFQKILNVRTAKQVLENAGDIVNYDLNVLVYNMIDLISHARTEMDVLKALANDERAYRSLILTWFKNSPLLETLQYLSTKNVRVIIATDHGTIRVNRPSKVIGDKETTTNLRYKTGRNLQYNNKDVFVIDNPDDAGLPVHNISSKYIFAKEDFYFLYPNNYNYFNKLYNDTFQHGGISMEEMICPVITLRSK
ncbi:MAG: bifunctional response regulator/alkaline phosphatase family protein [Saprospiraceae bacterium]